VVYNNLLAVPVPVEAAYEAGAAASEAVRVEVEVNIAPDVQAAPDGLLGLF
jgi:hypothetical protein